MDIKRLRSLAAKVVRRARRALVPVTSRMPVTIADIAPPPKAPPDLKMVPAFANDRTRLVVINTNRNVDGVMRANLDDVVDALERAGVDYFVVPAPALDAPRIGVRNKDRDVVFQAIADRAQSTPLYVKVQGEPAVPAEKLRNPWRFADQSVFKIFTFQMTESRSLQMGVDEAVTLELWTKEDDLLVGPQPNPIATEVPPELATPVRTTVLGRTCPTWAAFEQPNHIDHVQFDIDLVYTWVDGNDPAWRERQRSVLEAGPGEGWHVHAASASRFHDREELRYSLRSVWTYGDFFRNIYLVTDRQVPPWLDTSHPKIRVVDHTEIFGDAGHLPTFNSHAIESRLHHIDGLAEHFLYMNDDVFFGRRVPPTTFFLSNGISRFALSKKQFGLGPKRPTDIPPEAAAKTNRDLLLQRFGVLITQKLKHTPHALRRSVLEELEKSYPDEWARTAEHQFRHPDDISPVSSFYQYYAYCTQRAIAAHIDYQYINLSTLDDEELDDLLDAMRSRRPLVYCLNDVDDPETPPAHRDQSVREFLELLYPIPSPWELAVPRSR